VGVPATPERRPCTYTHVDCLNQIKTFILSQIKLARLLSPDDVYVMSRHPENEGETLTVQADLEKEPSRLNKVAIEVIYKSRSKGVPEDWLPSSTVKWTSPSYSSSTLTRLMGSAQPFHVHGSERENHPMDLFEADSNVRYLLICKEFPNYDDAL
jgi:hypothetical protein